MKKVFIVCFFMMPFAFAFAQKKDTITKDTTTNDSTEVFTVVQVPASFPGGLPGWSKYLSANLNVDLGAQYVKIPKGQKEARQIVQVQFIVDTLGNISNVQAVNTKGIHPKLIKEAIRVIKEGPNWFPAMQNGKKVMYRHSQTITWVVTEE